MFLLSAATLFSAISSKWREISLMALFLHFLQNLWEFIRSLFSLHFIIHDEHRRLTASANTTTFFQRDLTIGRRLTQLNVEHLFGFFDQLRHSRDVTGRTEAKLDRMLAARLSLEKGIERDDPVDLPQRNVQAFCNIGLHEGGDVTDFSLHFVEHQHDSAGSFFILCNRLVNNDLLLRVL